MSRLNLVYSLWVLHHVLKVQAKRFSRQQLHFVALLHYDLRLVVQTSRDCDGCHWLRLQSSLVSSLHLQNVGSLVEVALRVVEHWIRMGILLQSLQSDRIADQEALICGYQVLLYRFLAFDNLLLNIINLLFRVVALLASPFLPVLANQIHR